MGKVLPFVFLVLVFTAGATTGILVDEGRDPSTVLRVLGDAPADVASTVGSSTSQSDARTRPTDRSRRRPSTPVATATPTPASRSAETTVRKTDRTDFDPDDPGLTTYNATDQRIRSSTVERALHRAINDVRAEHGLDNLSWFPAAASVSRAHSADLHERSYFAHENPDGESPADRFGDGVFEHCPNGYGENILKTFLGVRVEDNEGDVYVTTNQTRLVDRMIDSWMDSPGHRKNILRSRWTSAGLGVYVHPLPDRDGAVVFATQNFCGT